jgi:hydrogenase small subunit
MAGPKTGQARVSKAGMSRRCFLKFCATMASALALPTSAVAAFSEKLVHAKRPSVIWLSFQECTGCTESLTRAQAPSIEALMFDYLSLDYHHTLQAASGVAAEAARAAAISQHDGKYLLIIDGSIPVGNDGVFSTIAGKTNLQYLQECASGAAAVISVGTCAAFGGLPAAYPNPTGATGVATLMEKGLVPNKPLVNLPGCPPLPVAISGVLAHYLAFNQFPELDELKRPIAFYGHTVHQRCSRLHFYQQEKFAERFDDEGARKGWCLFKLGCKGPVTHNACASYKWNQGTSFPVEAGHPCLGCSEPGFWDNQGFYEYLDAAAIDTVATGETTGSTSEAGQALYQDNCAYCHPADPDRFELAADKIVELLRSGKVRSHQRLEFSDEQLNMLHAYLKSTIKE